MLKSSVAPTTPGRRQRNWSRTPLVWDWVFMGDTGHSANRADAPEFEGWALDVGA